MAVIYEDKASQGVRDGVQRKRQRLVAEITIDGQRRRKRGYNYRALQEWLDEQMADKAASRGAAVCVDGKLRQKRRRLMIRTIRRYLSTGRIREVSGFGSYAVDTLRGKVYNIRTGAVISPRAESGNREWKVRTVSLTGDDGRRYHMSFQRLKYAVGHGINPLELPQGFAIDDDGRVMMATDAMKAGSRRKDEQDRRDRLDLIVREMLLMREYYATLDIAPVEMYLAGCRSHIIMMFVRRSRGVCRADVNSIYDKASYRMLQNIERRGSMITSLTGGIIRLMDGVVADERRMKCIEEVDYGRGVRG